MDLGRLIFGEPVNVVIVLRPDNLGILIADNLAGMRRDGFLSTFFFCSRLQLI